MNITKIRPSVKTSRVWSGYPEDHMVHPTPRELALLRARIEACRQLHVERYGNEDYPFWSDLMIAFYLEQ